jgi:UDP-N-acetylmuramoylalanine--D-glutamate ligase
MDLKNKKITVVGLGISGRAAALILKQKGAFAYATDISESDSVKYTACELRQKGIYTETGKHTEVFIKGSEYIVVSPGVHDTSEALKIAERFSIPIITEIELASWFWKGPIIAVTGTNGKSTVATLTGLLLANSGRDAVVCGNIGNAFCGLLTEVATDQIAVVETSSFQLKRISSFKPKVSAIINISQDHFDWHKDLDEYFECKKNIYKNQDSNDFCILNYDDERLRHLNGKIKARKYFYSIKDKPKGAYLEDRRLVLNIDNNIQTLCRTDDIRLKGNHNIANILCACLCSYLMGASKEGIKKTLSAFGGLRHRFEDVSEINGVRFIDDSKATTVDACRVALLSCNGNVILIAGGRDKGSDFSAIKDIVSDKVKKIILIGEAADKISKAFSGKTDISSAKDMQAAVTIAWHSANKGDTVLLSPMCASFDMYRDYKQRGDVFTQAVLKLKKKLALV